MKSPAKRGKKRSKLKKPNVLASTKAYVDQVKTKLNGKMKNYDLGEVGWPGFFRTVGIAFRNKLVKLEPARVDEISLVLEKIDCAKT